MARIQITISTENAQTIAALKQVAGVATQTGDSVKKAGSGAGFDSATKSAGGLLDKLSKITIVGAGIVGILREIKDTAAAVLGPGFKFSMDTETTRLGMAGILQSMTLIDGKAVSFNEAIQISSDTMKKLQQDALRTAANVDELRDAFLAALAPGVQAGMTIEQIRQLTTVSVNALKSLKVPAQQTVQEIRDLIQGGITASGSTLATALGLTDADIEKAKNSSEGLFKFLMDRMKGFEETSKRFPDTMRGRMDQLEEVFTQGGAAFASKFEEPIKEGLSAISDAIGEVDDKTGEIHLNPAFASSAEEVNGILSEMKSLAKDLAPSFSWIGEDVVPACKDLWGSLKDIGSMVGDSLRIILKETRPVIDFFAQGFRDLAHDIKEATGWLANWFDVSARKTGVKTPVNSSSDDNTRGDRDYVPPGLPPADPGNITAKYPDNKKAVENSQSALKMALASIEADAKKAIAEIKREQESIEVLFKQSMISAEEYARRKTELEIKIQQVTVDEAQRKFEAIQGAQYDKDSEKNVAVSKANEELNIEIEKLRTFGTNLDDVNKAIGAMTGASDAWRKEVENVNIDGLQDNAKAAINSLAAYFYQQTGRQMVVSSGLRDWGGHVGGTKFDVVDDATSELLEKNVNGIRDKVIAYAESIGLKVLDEYANPSEKATAGHLDFNAKDFTASFAAQAKIRIGQVLTKSGLEYLNSILELMDQADEIVKSLAEAKGDVSSQQKAELVAKYADLKKKFNNSLLPENRKKEILDDIDRLQKSEFSKLDFSQIQKNFELANGQLVTTQESLMNELAAGTKTATQVTDEYSAQYKAKTDKMIAELQRIITDADARGDVSLSNSARALLRQIVKSVNDFADAVIARIDAELQNEISMINIDRNLTSRQKQDKIDEVTRQAAAKRATEQEREAQNLREIDRFEGENRNAATIADLEQSARLNRELAKTPALIEKIEQAGKQGLEDGLLDFLERGVIECKNLGEAFRNLAITVLQSIQKIYAQEMTKRLMSAFGLGSYGNSASGNSSSTFKFPTSIDITKPFSFAEGGSMDSGKVSGPGTETSDSILAWVGNLRKFIRIANGEFVMRGAAVKKYGAAFLERLNSGQVPVGMLQKYAVGGSLTNRSIADIPGPQELSASLVSNNSTTIPFNIMNIIDPNLMGKFVQTREGKRALLNYIKDDAGTIKRILNIPG
ncbi:hypothetical protein [Sporomusa sp. KB1]|jgi:hypothetical protein|uniref:hypothetical protein n=1 Tax=Sporomusa sp. KB1 TaxID=943346 RepID=UPI0011A9F3DD|nr:hypothetical protein [Sporomusa sp. KB1]TWH48555.1 hypothetical protein Salpa_4720 [Sporomusa sp. KB1]